MTTIPFGAIVLTDFPFTDLTAAKRRPALVISTDNDRRTDVVLAYITSIPRADRDAMPIAPTAEPGLKVPSSVRFDKIATIDKTIIAGRIGDVDPAWLKDAREVFSACSGSVAQQADAALFCTSNQGSGLTGTIKERGNVCDRSKASCSGEMTPLTRLRHRAI